MSNLTVVQLQLELDMRHLKPHAKDDPFMTTMTDIGRIRYSRLGSVDKSINKSVDKSIDERLKQADMTYYVNLFHAKGRIGVSVQRENEKKESE